MDKQNFYTSQLVLESELDQVQTDVEAAEQSLAVEASVHQEGASSAQKHGGITSGLSVTRVSDTQVQVSAGVARDSQGRLINLPSAATVNLTALGDTDEGDLSGATGDGIAVAVSAGNEAWLSLFLVFDENLSQPKQDGLGVNLQYRSTESFHFHLALGSEAASGTATARAALEADKILLADILLDENEAIRQIDPGSGTADAICGSSADFNAIGYGLDDTPNLAGRRSDQVVADADGTDFEVWKDVPGGAAFNNNKRYLSLRGTVRTQLRQLAAYFAAKGNSSNPSGTEMVGTKEVTGKSLTATATAVMQMTATSLHAQLEAMVDKINNKIGRGGDVNLSGNYTTTGDVQADNLTATTNVTATAAVQGATVEGTTSVESPLFQFDANKRLIIPVPLTLGRASVHNEGAKPPAWNLVGGGNVLYWISVATVGTPASDGQLYFDIDGLLLPDNFEMKGFTVHIKNNSGASIDGQYYAGKRVTGYSNVVNQGVQPDALPVFTTLLKNGGGAVGSLDKTYANTFDSQERFVDGEVSIDNFTTAAFRQGTLTTDSVTFRISLQDIGLGGSGGADGGLELHALWLIGNYRGVSPMNGPAV